MVGVGGNIGIVSFLVSLVYCSTLLMLEADDKAEIAIFQGEVGMYEAMSASLLTSRS